MCDECAKYEYVCQKCGTITDAEFAHLVPYVCTRKELKNLVHTSTADTFVWFLRFQGKIVKVGYGTLIKLLNETRPNANYLRFDTAIIYWCKDAVERNVFACRSMGEIEGLFNRKGVDNIKYKPLAKMKWKTPVSVSVRSSMLGDPLFYIGETGYWDVSELTAYGVS